MKVLITEDDPSISKALESKMQKEGVEVVVVTNGKQAIEELNKGDYKVLLLDLLMPEVSGWDVLAHIKEKNISIITLIISNLATGTDRNKALDMGAKEYIVKAEINLSDLVSKVKNYIQG